MDKIYHYTTGRCWLGIEKDKEIKCLTGQSRNPSRVKLGKHEKPAIWLSTHPVWEQTANKTALNRQSGRMVNLDREQTQRHDGGLFRIVINTSVFPVTDWNTYKRIGGADPKLVQGLYNVGVARNCKPETEWFVSFKPIPESAWEDVQILHNGQWESIL